MSNSDTLLKRLQVELDGKNLDEIVDLNLDNCQTDGQVEGISDELSSLKSLSLIGAGLTTLKGFPKLLKLQKLELSNNNIEGSLSGLSSCISLSHLNLSGNKIENIDDLSALADLKNLTTLDLSNCEITKLPNYKKEVFKLLPTLKALDGRSQNDDSSKDQENDTNGSGNNHEEAVNEEENAEDQEEEGEESDGESVDEKEEYGLSYLEKDDIEDDDEDGDYEEEEDQEDEDIEDDDEDDGDGDARGVKRKHEEEEETN